MYLVGPYLLHLACMQLCISGFWHLHSLNFCFTVALPYFSPKAWWFQAPLTQSRFESASPAPWESAPGQRSGICHAFLQLPPHWRWPTALYINISWIKWMTEEFLPHQDQAQARIQGGTFYTGHQVSYQLIYPLACSLPPGNTYPPLLANQGTGFMGKSDKGIG